MLLSRVCRRLVPRGTCGMSSSPTSRGTVSPWASLPPLEQIMSPSTPSSIDEAAADCETIDLWLDEHDIAHVQLARPDKLNAVNMRMWWEIQHAFGAIDRDQRARAAVLSAQGAAFCAGMDLSVFVQMQEIDRQERCPGRRSEQLARLVEFLQDSCTALERCRVPVLAAVHGPCIGGGLDLVTAADLIYCTPGAQFTLKEVDLAIVADLGVLQRLPRLVGLQRTREMAYTARAVAGEEAEELGLAVECVNFTFDDDGEGGEGGGGDAGEGEGGVGGAAADPERVRGALLSYVSEAAQDIAGRSPITQRGIKQTLLHARDTASVAEGLNFVKQWNCGHLYSEDLQLTINALMQGERELPEYRN